MAPAVVDGEYPPELLTPDVVILLTVDEPQRAERLRRRGDPVTEEEQKLAHMKQRGAKPCSRRFASLRRSRWTRAIWTRPVFWMPFLRRSSKN